MKTSLFTFWAFFEGQLGYFFSPTSSGHTDDEDDDDDDVMVDRHSKN